jgi:hypothetical protein
VTDLVHDDRGEADPALLLVLLVGLGLPCLAAAAVAVWEAIAS